MKTFISLLIAVTVSASAFSQTKKDSATTHITHKAKYICTMDPDVVSDKPGKCPKCGMDLTKAKTYTCTMDPDVIADKPGKCPKCGMELMEVKEGVKPKKS
jgi:predicted Zn-ribbon and HTH transcriptional regulator